MIKLLGFADKKVHFSEFFIILEFFYKYKIDNFYSCKARLTQNLREKEFKSNCIVHNHQPISIRRRSGKLKSERRQHGLNPEYRNLKSKRH